MEASVNKLLMQEIEITSMQQCIEITQGVGNLKKYNHIDASGLLNFVIHRAKSLIETDCTLDELLRFN